LAAHRYNQTYQAEGGLQMSVLKERYELREKLGEGGMADVYRAYQMNLDRDVAIKFIKPSLTDEHFAARFEREAKAIARLSHPGIVQIHDFDRAEDGRYFMVMELLEGSDLSTRLHGMNQRGEVFGLRDALTITRQVADALGYAHQRDIVHRDIKPGNIFLTKDNRVIVTDFGIARIISEGYLTQTGMTIGTPHYFAPEQGSGQAVDHRVDIYALGVVLYQLLTGRVPYDADSTLAVLAQHANAPIPDPRELRPELPPMVTDIVKTMMAKSPADRYADASAFVQDTRRLADEFPEDEATLLGNIPPSLTTIVDRPTPSTQPPRTKHRSMMIALGGLLALIVTLAIVFGVLLRSDDDETPAAIDAALVNITPATEDEYLLVVADFVGDEDAGLDVAARIADDLRVGDLAGILGERFRLEEIAYPVSTRAEAEAVAETTNALIVVWGVQDASGLRVVMQAPHYPADTVQEVSFLIPPGDDFATILAEEVPIATGINSQALAMQRLIHDSEFIPMLQAAINTLSIASGIDEARTLPVTALDRHLTEMFVALGDEDYQAADMAISNALEVVPNDPMLIFNRWNINTAFMSNLPRARLDVRRMEEVLPDSSIPPWMGASTEYFAGDYDQVLAVTDGMDLSSDISLSLLNFYRQLSLFAQGRFEQSLQEMNEFTTQEVNPMDTEADVGFHEPFLAFGYEVAGDAENTTRYREIVRSSRLLEQSGQLWTSLLSPPSGVLVIGGYILEINDQDALATVIYQQALINYPDDFLLNWRRAVLAEDQGDVQQAYDRYLAAIENAPVPFPIATYQLALLTQQNGDPADACDLLESARRDAEGSPDFYAVLLENIAEARDSLNCD
jgi:serine/threonine protein kinase/tetratricopeptide (TPR) repeat protein